jgi:hypothetical protein
VVSKTVCRSNRTIYLRRMGILCITSIYMELSVTSNFRQVKAVRDYLLADTSRQEFNKERRKAEAYTRGEGAVHGRRLPNSCLAFVVKISGRSASVTHVELSIPSSEGV